MLNFELWNKQIKFDDLMTFGVSTHKSQINFSIACS